jgi:hypothetical protein
MTWNGKPTVEQLMLVMPAVALRAASVVLLRFDLDTTEQ